MGSSGKYSLSSMALPAFYVCKISTLELCFESVLPTEISLGD